jgi:putative DNA primase/helicase
MRTVNKNQTDVTFKVTKEGLSVRSGEHQRVLCPFIKVIASGTFEGAEIHHNVIRLRTQDGKKKTLIVPKRDCLYPMRVIERLADANFEVPTIPSDRKLLGQYIIEARAEQTALLTRRTGWHDDLFVTPEETFGESDWKVVECEPAYRPQGLFEAKGDLDEWKQRVAAAAGTSTRLMFAIGAALAAPLLKPAGIESGGFHFVGETSIGKTTTLIAAQSVWGAAARGELNTWEIKNASFEELAQAHCDVILCLDEIAELGDSPIDAARRARKIAFMIASGQGKQRSKRYAPRDYMHAKWRGLILSTGETGLSDISAAGGLDRLGGEEVRFVDVPAHVSQELGIFERLPQHMTQSVDAVTAIEDGCSDVYGVAGPALVRAVLEDPDVIVKMKDAMSRFLSVHNVGHGGWEGRFASRFALVYAALETASLFEIVPWKKKRIMRAVTACYLDALGATRRFDRVIEMSLRRLGKRLRSKSRILDVEGSTHSEAARKKAFAYKVCRKEGSFFAIKAPRFEKFMGGRATAQVVLRALQRTGVLVTQPKSSSFVKHVAIKGLGGRKTYYCVREEFIDADYS